MITVEQKDTDKYFLTEEGEMIADKGSHEARVFNAIPSQGLLISELQGLLGTAAAFGQGKAFKNKWIKKDRNTLFRAVESIKDQTQSDLLTIKQTGSLSDQNALKDLKKRQLIDKTY
jgi:phenylalanyl-tRNA synthetase alpha chain